MKLSLSVCFNLLLSTLSLHAADYHPGPPANARGPLDLTAITRAALADNAGVRAARANWEAMRERVPQAGAWEDPNVSYTGRVGRFVEVSRNAFTDHTLSLEQKVPLNGKNRSRARAASAEAVVAHEGLRRAELDVAARVAAAYYRLANARGQLELNRQNEGLLSEFVNLSRLRYEVGTNTQADVLTATVERARIVEARADLERTRDEAESALNVLLNRPARAPLGTPAPLSSDTSMTLPPAARLEALALAFRPEVRIGQQRVAAAQARLQLARREWVPDPALRVTGQQYNGAAQAVSEVDLGVTFTLPWLNAHKYRAETREMQAGVTQAARDLERVKTETLGLVRDQLTRIHTLRHHHEVYRDTVLPLARQAISANRDGYAGSKSGFLELITAERTLRDAEAESQMHLADSLAAVAELDAVLGVDPHASLPAQK